jgi:hypothetical protein
VIREHLRRGRSRDGKNKHCRERKHYPRAFAPPGSTDTVTP